MSRICEITKTGPTYGNRVSHSNIKTRTRWLPNIKTKKFFIQELGRTMTIKLCASVLRTIDKQGGLVNALMEAKDENLSERLVAVKRAIQKQRRA